MTTSTSTPDRPISIKSESSKQLIPCTILKEHLDRIALAFLSSQGIFSSEELLNRSTSQVLDQDEEREDLSFTVHFREIVGSKRKKSSSKNSYTNNGRSNSVLGADSPLTKALYEWRFEQDNDPKPSPKLRTQQDKIRSCVQMLHRWVRKIKIVTGVPCSKGTKMMAESSALGLNENDESNDLQLLGEKPRQFLYSEGIYSGNDLLRIRTGDLGINYKKWREKNGLKELKSPGGASSISGWKNIIRTAKGIKKGSVSAKLIPLPRRVQLSCTTGAKTVVKQEIPTQVTPQLVSFEEQQQDFFDEEIHRGQDNMQCMYDGDDNVVQPIDRVDLDDLIYLRQNPSVIQDDDGVVLEQISSEAKHIPKAMLLTNTSVLDVRITEI